MKISKEEYTDLVIAREQLERIRRLTSVEAKDCMLRHSTFGSVSLNDICNVTGWIYYQAIVDSEKSYKEMQEAKKNHLIYEAFHKDEDKEAETDDGR